VLEPPTLEPSTPVSRPESTTLLRDWEFWEAREEVEEEGVGKEEEGSRGEPSVFMP
jgi:hypothetical protein